MSSALAIHPSLVLPVLLPLAASGSSSTQTSNSAERQRSQPATPTVMDVLTRNYVFRG